MQLWMSRSSVFGLFSFKCHLLMFGEVGRLEMQRSQPFPSSLKNTCSPGSFAMERRGNHIFSLWCRDGDTPELSVPLWDPWVLDLDWPQLLEAVWGRESHQEIWQVIHKTSGRVFVKAKQILPLPAWNKWPLSWLLFSLSSSYLLRSSCLLSLAELKRQH